MQGPRWHVLEFRTFGLRRPRRLDARDDRRSQSAAAPPERVSDSLTNDGGAEMPRGHYLTETVKDAIWGVRAEGLSEAEIGRRLGLPKRTVSKYLERLEGSGRGPAVGRSVA